MSARPAADNGDYSFSKTKFSAGNNPTRRDANRKNYACMWRFVENEGEDDTKFEGSKFLDFPIARDESDCVQSAQRRERWKLETLERRKNKENATEKEDDLILRSDNIERRFEYDESTTDDEDIVEWFGHKPETKR